MAGPRKAQYVSIPMGPGVLSNTTGRGAKSRVNYMNWDRWKDSSWVRWHKLLPEKQGGWSYQSLYVPNAPTAAVPGSPVLLLHFNGNPGDESTTDSSPYNQPMTILQAAVIDNGEASPFDDGTTVFDAPFSSSFPNGTVCYTPIESGGVLDMSNLSAWTIEFFMYTPTLGGSAARFMGIGTFIGAAGDAENGIDFGTSGGFGEVYFQPYGALTNSGTGPVVNTVTGGWHHYALVKRPNQGGPAGDQYQMFVDGVGTGWTSSADPFQGPYNAWEGWWVVGGYHDGPESYDAFHAGGFQTYWKEIRATPSIAVYEEDFTPPAVQNTWGTPNTQGTINPPNQFVPSVYLGVARGLCDWASLDGQFWIAIGTHLKLYVVNQATLYDITPDRKTSNVYNAMSTVASSEQVTIVDAGHQASTGDFIDIIGSTAVGGLTLNSTFQISVVDPNTYTITAQSAATATVTGGGGSFSINYELGAGLPANGELLGYGTSTYGYGTYGTPRPIGTGVYARMRTWSVDNYGQDLIASQSDGEIYWWQRNSGPQSPAAIIPAAPTGCQRVIVDAQQRVIIAFGCTDETGTYDAMLVRWCSFDDITDWVETDVNTAGSDLLTAGSRIITALKTKGQNLVFTDTTLYRQVFVGGTDEYDHYPAGQVTIVGPNAAVDVDGVAYLMGFDNFYNYSGTLNLQSCDVWETVFDPNNPNSLLRTQSEAVECFTYEPKTEITWLYPSIGGVFVITFTEDLALGATAATLVAPWDGVTGYYDMQFSDQESMVVLLEAGETTATWVLPLTGPVSTTATFIGNDRYVTFNWEDGTWYYGQWYRTAAKGRSPAMNGYPYGVNAGYLYQHEVGTDAVEAAGTTAIGWYMESLDITVGGAKSEFTMGGSDARFAIGGSDAHLLMRSFIPDWIYMTGAMNLTVWTKDRPQETNYVVNGPVAFAEATAQIDIDAHGSQLVLRLDNFTAEAGAASLGSSFRMGILQGMAVPYAKR